MKCRFTFHHVDTSRALQEYTQDQMDRLERVRLRDGQCQVHYSKGRYDCQVELIANGPWGRCKSTGIGDDFYHAVDAAVEKLSRQLRKKKDQLRHHKAPERSREARLERVNESLEYDNNPYFKKPA